MYPMYPMYLTDPTYSSQKGTGPTPKHPDNPRPSPSTPRPPPSPSPPLPPRSLPILGEPFQSKSFPSHHHHTYPSSSSSLSLSILNLSNNHRFTLSAGIRFFPGVPCNDQLIPKVRIKLPFIHYEALQHEGKPLRCGRSLCCRRQRCEPPRPRCLPQARPRPIRRRRRHRRCC